MKLSLASKKGVEILSVSESVATQDIKVLRAGMGNILKTGKNKIILALPDQQDLSSDILRELAEFDVLARELSGRVVLAKVSAQLKSKIEFFAKPPVILCFETIEKAFEFLTAPVVEAPASSTPTSPVLDRKPHVLEKRVRDLELETTELKKQIVLATIARRAPANEGVYQDQIQDLESQVEKLLLEVAAFAAAAPKQS